MLHRSRPAGEARCSRVRGLRSAHQIAVDRFFSDETAILEEGPGVAARPTRPDLVAVARGLVLLDCHGASLSRLSRLLRLQLGAPALARGLPRT